MTLPTVLISGASIAGPTLAHFLTRAGFTTTVVERAPAPRPGGQAIDIRGPALAVMDRMGLLDHARARRTRLKGMSFLDIDGKEIGRTENRTLTGGRFDSPDIEILRDDLADLLLGTTRDSVEYIYGDTITALACDHTGWNHPVCEPPTRTNPDSFPTGDSRPEKSLDQRPDSVGVTFRHAPPRRFGIVIGADGLHSNVRHLAFGEERSFLRHLGVGLAIYTTPNILDLRDWQLAFRDDTSGYVVYPARNNTELRVNLGFGLDPEEFPRGDLAAQKALITRRCAHLRGDIPRLLQALRGASDIYFGPLAQVRMDCWSKGRVTLAGDAGYCPSPFSGQGTSLALIGAFVLARELTRSPADPQAAFTRYEDRMRPFVLMNQDMVSVERKEQIPDDVFDRAKNGIMLDDLLQP